MTKLKKVIFVVSDDFYFLSHRLATALFLQSQGYEIAIATCVSNQGKKNEIENYNIKVFDLAIRSKGIDSKSDLKVLFRLRKIFNQFSADYIHAVSMRMVFIALIAFKLSKAKNFIGMITGLGYLSLSSKKSVKLIKSGVIGLLRLLCLSNKVSLICQNEDDYAYLINKIISKKRLHLIKGSGVDINKYQVKAEPEGERVIVTFVARMLKDKGVVELYQAAKMIKDQGYENITVQLVGDIHEANPNSLTTKELQTWHDSGVIKWLGYQRNIVKIYQNSHIAVLPSYGEGLPKSLLEAAACGRAIIATDVPGCREICKNGVNGILIPVKGHRSLADAIIELANNPRKRAEYGANGRKMVEEQFSDYVINQQIYSLYKKISKVDS